MAAPAAAAAVPQVGCAGHKLTDITHDQEDWLEYATVRHGYGRVTVSGADSLLFEMVGHGEATGGGAGVVVREA